MWVRSPLITTIAPQPSVRALRHLPGTRSGSEGGGQWEDCCWPCCCYLDVLRMPPGASLLLQLARLSVLLLELPRLLWAVVLEYVTVTVQVTEHDS